MVLFKNKVMNEVKPLIIGDGKLKKRIEFNLGWKKFTIIVRW